MNKHLLFLHPEHWHDPAHLLAIPFAILGVLLVLCGLLAWDLSAFAVGVIGLVAAWSLSRTPSPSAD